MSRNFIIMNKKVEHVLFSRMDEMREKAEINPIVDRFPYCIGKIKFGSRYSGYCKLGYCRQNRIK